MMAGLLLDTHALIWWWLGDPSLSRDAQAAIEADDNQVAVSSVSLYEIASKERSGRLPALRELLVAVDDELADVGFSHLPLSMRHAVQAGMMAGDRRDPFDRMIAAQALIEGMTVVTRDTAIASFGCETLW